MPIKKIKQINLIPQEEFEGSTTGRILKWALSTFRATVIITELIVMGAFLSRFWFDAKNSDLDDELNLAKSQVLAYTDIENQFKLNQKKLAIAKSLYTEPDQSIIFTDLSKLIPMDVILQSILIIEKDLNIKAYAFSEQSIVQFLINLENYKVLSDVNLLQISQNKENPSVSHFSITAKVDNITAKVDNITGTIDSNKIERSQ